MCDVTYPQMLKKAAQMQVCTSIATGPRTAVQPWYQCTTCQFGPNMGVCETCKTQCHAGHNLIAQPPSSFLCDCSILNARPSGLGTKCVASVPPSEREALHTQRVQTALATKMCTASLTGKVLHSVWTVCRLCIESSLLKGGLLGLCVRLLDILCVC